MAATSRVTRDLREWLAVVEQQTGQVRRLDGADWNLEIGSISALAHRRTPSLAVLFDHIKDYPPGFRVLTNPLGSLQRFAATVGLPLDLELKDSVRAWRELTADLRPVPPRFVEDGPVMENVLTGQDVNMWMFPTPLWHEKDGGRYIGTAHVDITRDRETGGVNLGVYRVMVHDEKHLCFYISPGKDGFIHRQQYFDRGEPCPVAISFGHHPLLYLVGGLEVPHGLSEYDYAGGLLGEPLEVIRGPVTGLPIPARAEIAIEGFARPDLLGDEGPFGEWTGYYASSA
ncbi:MAG: UbiD family decarboxylase, partial [Armatimonadota bacterium]|nr:UbiD family decarboxylase [Armatimonadota bacterium]